jgi:Aerobic-type carbon monoxide dehydrogenase, small subunit CoxS/CutS homologs
VLVDGDARVSCVTPAARIAGRSVTTLAGLDVEVRDGLVDAFVATGASQCGFCTPGIIVRLAALSEKGKTAPANVDRALAAHLCRCTGWQTISDAAGLAFRSDFGTEKESGGSPTVPKSGSNEDVGRDFVAAGRRAELEGGAAQGVGPKTPLGDAGFADDSASRDALVGVPCPPGSDAETVSAAGIEWVTGESLDDARRRAGKVQGRRTTAADSVPLPLPNLPDGGVRLATGWVEPAYLEPDASWCEPGGEPASTLANGGAFGGKTASAAPIAARELADAFGRTVRVVFAREDVVRLGPKRPPMAASAFMRDGHIEVRGVTAAAFPECSTPYDVGVDVAWEVQAVKGPPVSRALRATGLAETTVLVEGAIDAARVDRATLLRHDARAQAVVLDAIAVSTAGALAGARVEIGADSGAVRAIHVRVDAGDPLDDVVLRSYVIGAAHMALGWVLTEGIAVDPDTGEVLDLTIRSFGIIRPKSMPPVRVEIMQSGDAPRALASDAVFAAVAAATWNAVTRAEGRRPETFPAVDTRAARMLRR